MTLERNYKQEAQSARTAARETLMAFREARLRSRKTGNAPPKSAEKPEDTGALIAPETFFSMETDTSEAPPTEATATDLSEDMPDEAEADTEDDVVTHAEAEAEAAPETESEPESLEEEDGTAVAATEIDDAGDETLKSTEENEEDVVEQASEDPPADGTEVPASETDKAERQLAAVNPDSDLFELPGAGAGMVWMFHQCGIRSLSDLSDAEARDLSLRLGVVGHILNVEPWIAFARERVSGSTA